MGNKKQITLKSIIIILFSLRILSVFTSGFSTLDIKKMLMVNPDEMLIAEVAINYHNGLGFVSSSEIYTPKEAKKYYKTKKTTFAYMK
jgi:hypothetical protein